MPALLTRMSTEPKLFSPSAIISAICAGLVMSAGEWTALTLKSASMLARSFSMSAGAPMPLRTILAPAPAKARAYASPMPLVEPVTTAVLPVKLPISFTLLFVAEGFGAVACEVISDHGFVGLRPLQPFLVTHRKMNVAHPRSPVLDHADVGKIVILGRRFVILAAIDQVHHRDGVFLGGLAENFNRRIVLEIVRQLADQLAQRLAGVVNLPVLVGVHAGTAGKADVLLALRCLEQRNRQLAARTEQIDLEDQKVVVDFGIQHVIERRVGGDAAVPEMLALDDNGREPRRQRAGCHDVLRPDLLAQLLELEIVEILEVAGGHTHRAEAEPCLQIVDAVEIDQMLQRFSQRRGVVIALRLRAALRPQRRRRKTRREKPGNAEGRDQGGAGLVEERSPAVALRDGIPWHRRRDHLPEFLETLDPLFTRIAGDDRGVDGADRDAGDPFRLEIEVTQGLIGAGLIGAERAAALQNKHALRLRGRACRRWTGIIHLDRRSINQKRSHRGVSSRRRQSAKQ